jgi:hypothetical protein
MDKTLLELLTTDGPPLKKGDIVYRAYINTGNLCPDNYLILDENDSVEEDVVVQ